MAGSTLAHDVFFFSFLFLLVVFIYLLLATLYSMRSPTTRQQRLNTNRFLLRLRQDTTLLPSAGIDRTPKSAYDMPKPPPPSPPPGSHRAMLLRSLVEAMAHPLPFLAMYSNFCLTLVVAYLCYTLNGHDLNLVLILLLSPFFGGIVSSVWLFNSVYNHWHMFGSSGDVILRNSILGASTVFGLTALVIRWRELIYPACSCRRQNTPLGDPSRGSSYDRGWGMFRSDTLKNDDESSYPSKNERSDSVEPRLSNISDITLDEAIRTPPHQMFGAGALDKSLMSGPSSDYMEMEWHWSLFQHAGARLVYADLACYLVATSGLIVILEPWKSAVYWVAANCLSLGGGGVLWVVVRGWEGTTFNAEEE